MTEETADKVGRRWASSTESQGAGRYSSFRKKFNGFGPRSTLPFGLTLKPKSPFDSKLEAWEKRDGPRPTKSLSKQILGVGQSNGGPKEKVNPKGSLEGLNDPKKKFKDTGVEPMEERKSIPRASLRRQEIREERRVEGRKEEEEKEEL